MQVSQSWRLACPLRRFPFIWLTDFAGLLLKGSMSLDFRVTPFPCESSSFATPQAVAEQPVLTLKQLMKEMFSGALLCPLEEGERWCRRHQRGNLRHNENALVMLLFVSTPVLSYNL